MTVKRGDYVVVRTGQMEAKLKAGSWDGYPGGDAPGFAFETLDWVARTQLAALASDTWGCEVRPNETEPGINQPWHWITIPIMGMTMGEIFYVKELAEDCAADGVYEFMFVAPGSRSPARWDRRPIRWPSLFHWFEHELFAARPSPSVRNGHAQPRHLRRIVLRPGDRVRRHPALRTTP